MKVRLFTVKKDAYKIVFSAVFISYFMYGFAYGQAFTPAQEPLIRDLRPKPNIMLTLDTSKAGKDTLIELSEEEKELFKNELESMGLQNRTSISKTEAISAALLKLLGTYQHIAHFGLARIGEASPYAYITQGNIYYEKDETINVNPIILPINTNYNGADKDYVGNYSKLHSTEKQHLNTLKKSIANFQQQYSTDASTRAWAYGISELNKYFWGSRYYLDDSNRNYDKKDKNPRHIANLILPEDIGHDMTGEARIDYKTYDDPIRFICQQSHILYFPVEKSGAYDLVSNYDRIINVPVTVQELDVGQGGRVALDKADDDLDGIYATSPSLNYRAVAKLLSSYMPRGNINDEYLQNRSYCHLFGGRYGLMRSLVNTKGNGLVDLHGNLWSRWSGSQCTNGAGAYEPSDLHTSAIYVGEPFDIPGLDKWNEKNYSGSDFLQGFIQVSTRQYVDMKGTVTEGTNVNGTPFRSKATSVYLRANRNQAPTLSSIHQRSKEYLDKIVLSYKSNGRFIMDQHVPEQKSAREYIGYSISHNEQFWTSEIRAYDPRKPLKSNVNAGSYYFSDPYNEPTWTTTEKIQYDQGKFFTFDKAHNKEQVLNSINISSVATVDHVRWLKGDLSLPTDKFRVRNIMLGDIINSDIAYEARDHFHINLDLVGDRERYVEYMYQKRDSFENNLIIAGSNDGFLNFIVAGRNSEDTKKNDIAGTRKASYFVSFFKNDIGKIVEPLPWYGGNFQHQYRVDGKINIFDAIVDGGFKTTGIAGMGAGYKGIAGFELFSINEDKQVDNKGEVKALFEIDDETFNFHNLGYTYSGFSFLNDSSNDGRSVAVFGNGPGNKNNISSLFFINAVTGEFIGEIELSDGKGGAFTPTLVLTKDEFGQKINTIYVGDYSGKLFKVDFTHVSGELSEQVKNAEVVMLFDAASDVEGRPISTKPYVIQNKQSKSNWLYFGTGMLATQEQKDSNVTQNFFAIEDKRGNDKVIQLDSLNKLSLNQTYRPSQYNGLSSSELIHELFVEVKGARRLKASENGWFIPLSLNVNKEIIPKSFDQKIYEGKPSIHVIYPAASLMGNTIMFSAREIFDSKTDNLCASDVVQTPVFALNTLTGEPAFKGQLNAQNEEIVGANILANQGILAPFRTFGGLTQDSYVGNIESGYNISLQKEERIRLDDVKSLYGSDVINSNSSNIGGRRKAEYGSDRYILDYQKYHYYINTVGTWQGIKEYYNYLPYSSVFGEEGSSEGYPLGYMDPEPKKVLTPKRLSVRKIL